MKRIFSIAVLAIMTFTISCSQTSKAENTVDIDAKGPSIEFKDLVHNYGTITQGDNGTCEFSFKNTGTEPLILQNVRSSCGCTIPSWPKEAIAPGKSNSIVVKYDTRRIGPISKTITVTSNGSEQPIILRIKGKIEPKPAESADAN
jgi:hypothetical protein